MTQLEALDEARRKWGERAFVSDRHWRASWGGTFPKTRFMVTDCEQIYGLSGDSWEDAFADADTRKKDIYGSTTA
jgi:hypothetical protein